MRPADGAAGGAAGDHGRQGLGGRLAAVLGGGGHGGGLRGTAAHGVAAWQGREAQPGAAARREEEAAALHRGKIWAGLAWF